MIVTLDELVPGHEIHRKIIKRVFKLEPGPNGFHVWYLYSDYRGERVLDYFYSYKWVDNVRVYKEEEYEKVIHS